MKWFDRKFRLDEPLWMMPNIIERLRGTPVRLEEMLDGMTEAQRTAADKQEWSAQEHAGHLLDLEPLWSGRVEDILRGASHLREADLLNRKTHEAGHNRTRIDLILHAFRKERQGLISGLDALTAEDAARSALHPRLEQPMRIVDLLFFVAEHDDHHLADITRLRLGR